MKVNQFNDNAKDTLDEWVYFLKNSEVKDNFKANGLKEAGEVLDIMRLSKNDEYGYNRYLDSLHHKASELFTLETEARFKEREDGKIEGKIEVAIKLIENGANDDFIGLITGLMIDEIRKLRSL